ncbi:hypothetical protein HYT23_01555 [Candidatus Pacearchaeota archaeon]|nr:hypothetical protein [Candidatus Pacearchaeota archaeon]
MRRRYEFNEREIKLFERLNTPAKVQSFVNKLAHHPNYNDQIFYSPRKVVAERIADCVDVSMFAAAAFRIHGERPLVMNLCATANDVDHFIALFMENGRWGAIGKSGFAFLEYREPIYKNLRELALSYFEGYFDRRGRKTLRGYSGQIDLSKFDRLNWMTSEEHLDSIVNGEHANMRYGLFDNKAANGFSRVSRKMHTTGIY